MKFSDKEEQQLKRWSCIELDAIGQQNPDVLAKIIVSSVKEDKNVNALKAHCISQLKTFLKTYTEDFVEVLFQAIEGIALFRNVCGVRNSIILLLLHTYIKTERIK